MTTRPIIHHAPSLRSVALATTAVIALSTASAPAIAQTWTGATSTDWFTAANWNPAAAPTAAGDATINTNTVGNQTVINASGAAKGLTLGSVAGQTGALDVTGAGALSIGADNLTVGDFGNGTITIEAGGNVAVASGAYTALANNAGSTGKGTVTGAGSVLSTGSLYLASDASSADFTVSNGGTLSVSSLIDLADFDGSHQGKGNLTVTGAGSQFTTNTLQVGSTGTGLLKISGGAHGNVSFFSTLGSTAGSTGTAQIDGNGTIWATGTLNVGDAGNGSLQITGGGLVQSGIVSFASSINAGNGTASVDGVGTKWTTGNFLVGTTGHGNVSVTNGGQIISTLTTAGPAASVGNGTFTVNGAGSSWKISGVYSNGALYAGRNGGLGVINVLAGGTVTVDATETGSVALADMRLGLTGNGTGVLNIDGAGSSLTQPYNTYIGYAGNSTGTITVSNGGSLTTGYTVIALGADATSATADSVTVTGAGSLWTIKDTPTSDTTLAQGLTIGSGGTGVLTIANGGTVTLDNPLSNFVIGGTSGSSGTLNIGAAAGNAAVAPGTLNASRVIFGTTSPGPLTVNFNHTSSNYIFAPQLTGSGPGTVNILAGTTIFTADDTYTGNTTISPGATLQLGNAGTTGSVNSPITDNGALILNHSTAFSMSSAISGTGNLSQVGVGNATLTGNSTYTGGTTIANGSVLQIGSFSADGSIVGNVSNGGAFIFFNSNAHTFDGVISANGSFQKGNGGNLTITGASTYTGNTSIQGGRLILGGTNRLPTATNLSILGATLDLNGFDQTVGNLSASGTIVIGSGNFTAGGSANATLSAALTGTGRFVKQGSGTFNITGSKTFSGATTVGAGRVNVNGSMAASTFDVLSGATLGGNGTVGATSVETGGVLAGTQGQTLTLAALDLKSGAKVNVGLGAPGTMALFAVNGDLTLDGAVNITSTGAFGAGLYRLMTYGGALTDNGLDVGTTPTNVLASDITVQTSVANQVNLIFSPSPTAFWNGSTLTATSAVVGGAGTWSIGPTNWTDATGAISGGWGGGFAIFEGAPGVVTIDNTGGAIIASGLQFAVDGYSVGGGVLILTDASPVIRVGDGTVGGASDTATISAVIDGMNGLTKTDLGTLALSGINTYSGGTTISGGVLSVGADVNLGAVSGNVTLNGGTLRVTTGFASARGFDAAAPSGMSIDALQTLNLTGALNGAGNLTKAGAGALEITGASSYSGAITVAAGRLEVDNVLGGGSLDVTSGATLAGNGSVGAAMVENGGVLAGTQGQTLNLSKLALNSGAKVDVTLGAPGTMALFAVGGNLTVDGTLNVSSPGAFGAGLYRIMTYGGALTDNGLDVGTTPSGVAPSNLTVQTSIAGQVNLIYDTGPLSFWNGATLAPASTVVGGTGTWSVGPTNWTNADGSASGPWGGDFAIFTGSPGTVTVDSGGGAVSASGLQFAVDGYTVGGATLTLTGASPTVRVGDGTLSGASDTATISAVIAGANGLDKTDLGTLILSGNNTYAGGTSVSAGNLSISADSNLGAASGNLTLDGGTLKLTAGFDSGRTFDVASASGLNTATGATLNVTGALSGSGGLAKTGAGTLKVTGTSTYTGALSVSAGALEIDADLGGGSVDILSGATLSGTGSLGATTIESSGILVGTQGQTLTLGSLSLAPGAKVNVGLADPGTTALFAVTGALALDGTLNVSSTGAFGAGLYRIMTYGGTLTDNALDIGSTPSGVASSDLAVQTSVAGQVNLVYTASPLPFWNGSTLSPTSSVVGGSGTWSVGPTNWTNAGGTASGAWDGGFAIFAGSPGTVTISNGGGAVGASGLQFAVSDYSVGGSGLTLTGGAPNIRVGDGTLGGAAYTATISAAIAGTAGLDKTDLGTLVLSGANTYSGGTVVSAGTLSVSSNANLGDSAGNVTLDGGILKLSAGFASGRTFDVASASDLDIATGATLNATGAITGAGALTKASAGVLQISGASSYSGAMTVSGGALVVNSALGATSVTLQSGTSLSGTGSIAGAASVQNGANLVGVQGQTLTIGALTLAAGSSTNITLSAPGDMALFSVTHDLTLDGTLNVTGALGFGEGVYRIMDYGGALTDNGLAIGAVASGSSAANYTVQTAAAGQVNLVYAIPSGPAGPFLFWDGDGAGSASNGAIDGGSGTWTTTSTNFTDANGVANGPMTPQPGFVVFQGAPGTVTVNDTPGQVSVTGMQFAASGYAVTGDAIDLANSDTQIRVGDGTAPGAGFTATLGAALTGRGGLEKTDLGTLVLSGVNTYTGGTIVSGGTLSGSATSFGAGAITDNATLIINQTGDATLANSLAGNGGLIKSGVGSLNLTGDSSFSGVTTVSAGRLAVNGSLVHSSVTVAGGAVLGGNGVVGGVNAQAGATVAPGNSIGVLTVSGNYAQASGSTYQVELDAAGHADRINVSGAATLSGGAVLNIVKTAADPYVLGTRYTVLTAGGLVSGVYDLTGATTSVTPFIGLVADYDAHDVYLDVTKIRSFASAASTRNQIAAASAADDLLLAGAVPTILANLPTIAAADAAFDNLSGEIHASARGAMLEDGRSVRDGVLEHLARLDGLRDRQTGLWAEAVVGSRRFYGDGNAATAHGGDTTILAGFDHGFGRLTLGLAVGYESADLDVEARASAARLEGWHIAGYGQADLGAGWAILVGGGYGGWTANIDRTVVLPGLIDRLHSHDRAGETQAFGEIAWTGHLGGARLQPFAGVGWSQLDGPGFAERGGVTALSGRGLAESIGSGKVGVRFDGTWSIGGASVRPHATLAFEQGFDARAPLAAVTFPGSTSGSSYTVAGPAFSRSRGDIDLGVNVSRGGFTLGAGYIGQFSRRAQQSGFKASASWIF